MGGHLINYAFEGKFLYECLVSILNVRMSVILSFTHLNTLYI